MLKSAAPLLAPIRTSAPFITGAPLPRHDLTLNAGVDLPLHGCEYVITTARQTAYVLLTPCQSIFWSVISYSGLACTWSENAHEYRLTPWSNDPVSDADGEALYLADEQRGTSGRPRRDPAAQQRRTLPAMHRAIALLSTLSTASVPAVGVCGSGTVAIKFSGSKCATSRSDPAAFPPPDMSSGAG